MVFILYIMFRKTESVNTYIREKEVVVFVSYRNVDFTKRISSDEIQYTVSFRNFSKSLYQMTHKSLEFKLPVMSYNDNIKSVESFEFDNNEYCDRIIYTKTINRKNTSEYLEDFDLMGIFLLMKDFRKKFIKFVRQEIKNKRFDFNDALNTFLNIEGYNHIIKNFK